MSSQIHPPRFARTLLRWVLPTDDRDGAVDALDEKFADYATSTPGPRWARGWYRRQVLGALHPRFWKGNALSLPEKGSRRLSLNWMQDVRFGLKMLAKTPGVTAVILVTLAVGIGFNGAMYSLLNTIVLNELPIEEPHRVLFAKSNNLSRGLDTMNVSYADYRDFAAAGHSFEFLGAWRPVSVNLSDSADVPERVVGAWVTPSMFDVLRVEPLIGRRLETADAEPGAERVGLLGYGLWQTRYGGDAEILGKVIQTNGAPTIVIGVLPPELEETPFAPEVWSPLLRTEQRDTRRDLRDLRVAGRLREGATLVGADEEFKQIAAQLEIEAADTNEGIGVAVETFSRRFTNTPNRVIVYIMMGAVGFLLLIACANVANLLISRSVYRTREIVIRSALGASRWRVMRQLLVESVLLSAMGAALSIVVAVWGARALENAIMMTNPPGFWDFSVKSSVFAFIATLAVATTLIFGLAPALHATRADVAEELKQGGRSSGGGRTRRLTGALVVVQLALAVVLLAGAGVMVRSTLNVQRVDWAVDPHNVLTMRLALMPADYPETDNIIAFHDELERRLSGLTSVEAVTLASSLPSDGGFPILAEIESLPVSDGHPVQMLAQMIVAANYFEMADTGVIRGRLFSSTDGVAGDPVIIVEKRVADRYWPDEDPIGKRMRWVDEADERWMRVVGVIPNIKQTVDMELAEDYPVVYTPYRQEPLRGMDLMVRSGMDPQALAALLREEVQAADADLPLYSIATLDEVISRRTFGFEIVSVMFLMLGATALFLSCLGIYAVMAFAVGRRHQEIGIRMALGAQRREVLGLVVRGASRQMAIGLALGLAGALAATRVMEMFMYQVSPNDPLTFALVFGLLVATALAACIVPARRASRVDPLVALRSD